MISYRRVKKDDWPQIKKLANQVFKEKIPMEDSFPLLFSENNCYSYVALDSKRIIGFIGVLPEELINNEEHFFGSRIGAVCISNDYQGQGIGRCLFRVMKEEAKHDFILVSGQGKLYIQEGCELFGEFLEYRIPGKSRELTVREIDQSIEELFAVHQLLTSKDIYFNKDSLHLSQLVAAQALANLWSGEQKIHVSLKENEIVAVVVICTRIEEGQMLTEVLEYGGKNQELLLLLQELATTTPNLMIRVPLTSELNLALEKIGQGKLVKNAGTILYLNEKLREVVIPHTWDLAFL